MPAMTWTPASRTLDKRWSFRDRRMPSDISFSRNDTSYYLNRSGLWTPLAANEPGFWYGAGATPRYRGYVAFGQRKNIMPSGSDDLSGGSWSRPSGIAVTANAATGAMNTATMWQVNDTATNANTLSLTGASLDTSGDDTFKARPRVLRAELKAGTASVVRARLRFTGVSANTEMGTFTLTGDGSRTAETSTALVSIEPLGNGTYLCGVGLRNTGLNTSAEIELSAGSTDSATGTFHVENIAIEEATEPAGAAFPGPPLAPQVTRAADRATAAYSWSGARAVVVQADCKAVPAGLSYAVCFNNSADNYSLVNIQFIDDPLQDNVAMHVLQAIAEQALIYSGAASGAFPRLAWGARVNTNDFSIEGKGIAGATDTAGSIPTGMDEVSFGFLDILTNGWLGPNALLGVDVYTTALTRAAVQQLVYL